MGVATRQVTVQPVHLDLSADPVGQAGADIRFSIRATGPILDNAQYRLNYGDGTDSSVSSSSDVAHAFDKPGEYTVTVQMVAESSRNEVVATARTVVLIKAPEVSPPNPAPSEIPPTPEAPPVSSTSTP